MSYKISQEKVDALTNYAKSHVPDIQVIYKDEPSPALSVTFIYFLASIVGFFSSAFKERWNTKISNSMGGKYIVFPSRTSHGDLTDYRTYVTYRHELVHILDSKKHGLWFYLSYVLLPLPMLLSWRAHWEFRGYAQNLIVSYEETGEITDDSLEWVAGYFSESLYVWMWPFKSYVRKKLATLRTDISAGTVEGFYPTLKWWKKTSL